MSHLTKIDHISHGAWAPEGAPDAGTIELLLWLMERHPITAWADVHPIRRWREWRNEALEWQYEDLGPYDPERPEMVRAWGNFRTLACGWSIDTDDPGLIATLTAAYAANHARFAERMPATYDEALRLHAARAAS